MNCKKGDLVIVVGGMREFWGRVFTVTERDAEQPDCWETNPVQYKGLRPVRFGDNILRPIRPGGGEDEMLRIAGKPTSEPCAHKPASDLPA